VSKRILLCIDDETTGLRIRKMILERSGYEVFTAESGPSGLEVFAAHPVDAVILDYFMPGMHGGEVAREMKRLKPEVPILLLSAYLDLPQGALEKVEAFITKGQSPQLLLDKIRELLGSKAENSDAAGES
jgi:CheY-like chemotaxis protein